VSTSISAAQAEQSEAEALYDFENGAPESTRTELGMESIRIGGGVALSVRNDTSNFWSKALGFGFEEPVTAQLIEQVCDFYLAQQTPLAILQMAPSVLPGDWADICAKLNITPGSSWMKLASDTEVTLARLAELPELASPLRVAPVERKDAAEWGEVMMGVFEMPQPGVSQMVAASVGRDGWHPYAVWDDEVVVGTGTIHVHRETGQLLGGATVPRSRRQGIQSALLAARAQAASAAGAQWLVAETGTEAGGTRNSSLHNMLRAGFSLLYERQNWIWRPAQREEFTI
jgi:GNAT superfamily N-acetyltransferase